MKTYKCKVCDYTAKTKAHLKQHNNSAKHKRNVKGEKKEMKEYYCTSCHYETYYKNAFDKHCQSARHIRKSSGEVVKKKRPICQFCNKMLKNLESLRRHQERYRKYDVYSKYAYSTKISSAVRRELEDFFLKHGNVTGMDVALARTEQKRILRTRAKKEKDREAKEQLESRLRVLEERKEKDREMALELKPGDEEEDEDEDDCDCEEKQSKHDYEKMKRRHERIPRRIHYNDKAYAIDRGDNPEMGIADMIIEAYDDEEKIPSPKARCTKVPDWYDVEQDPLFRSEYPRPSKDFWADVDWRSSQEQDDIDQGRDTSVYGPQVYPEPKKKKKSKKKNKKKKKTMKARKT